MISENKLIAIEIYNYMVDKLANGVWIKADDKKEMITNIIWLLESS